MDDKFTDIQEEKVYLIFDEMKKDKINDNLTSFFMELVKRKRDDPFEGGLQASIIIMPSKCAAKVCENDGKSPHMQAIINLIKYMNNDHKYISPEGIRYFGLYSNELTTLVEDCVEIRVLDGKDKLILAITSNRDIKSLFELSILEKLFTICESLMENKIYKEISIGLNTPTENIEFKPLNGEHLRKLNQSLINERERIEDKKLYN